MASSFGRFNLSEMPIGPALGAAWTRVRSALPGSCTEGTGVVDEQLHFAKLGGGGGGGVRKTDETELSHMKGAEMSKNKSCESLEDGDAQSESDAGGEFGSSHHKISEWQAGWNVTNAIQGMFVVSLPYAVLHGGYWAIIAMLGVAYICCYTGKILVDCLYVTNEEGQTVRVRDTYVSIAEECFGRRYGGKIVNTAQLIELLMTCILYVVLCGDLMVGTFPDGSIDTRSWMMICGILLIPCSFLKNLHHVSTLSFWCTMAHVAINVFILGYCLVLAASWGWSKVTLRINIFTFPISLGIIVFSYTSQIFLPNLEGNMQEPAKFHCMLNWSHIAAGIFKSLFGYVGFLTWQENTQEVITNNLPTQGFKGFINFILVVKALLSYPLPYYAAMDLLERAYFKGRPQTYFPRIWALDGQLKVWGLALRIGLVVFTVLMAISIPHFAILMGFIGSFTGTMLSFIWPCYFHLKLKGPTLDWGTVAYDCFVIFLGVLFGVIGIYYSFRALVEAFQIGLPF